MVATRAEVEGAIHRELIEICDAIGEDARGLDVEELIPATGLIDSAGLLELIAWYESHFGIDIKPEEITIDNLGSIRLMAEFAIRRMARG